MKTIEIISGDQKAQFTTKSVTLDGKEFLYSHMSDVTHDAENHIYSFTYDGETKALPYEEKYAKVLAAIFGQVQKLEEQRKAKAAAEAAKTAEADAPAEAKKEDEETPNEESSSEEDPGTALVNSDDADEAEKKEEREPVDPEKQGRIKKSLKIFAVIIAAVIVCAGIYYFVFGTNNAPSDTSPGNTESQQYEDIDQLIEDLQ